MHLSHRGNEKTFQHFQRMASDEGLQHIRDLIDNWSKPDTLHRLGMVVFEADLPIKVSKEGAEVLMRDESLLLKEDFKFQVAMVGRLVRQVLWHQEGLPGVTFN